MGGFKMTVKMTREQFDRVNNYRRGNLHLETAIHRTFNNTWLSKENICLNNLTCEELATAWIAPEKVEIIEPEITWQEAIQHIFFEGGTCECSISVQRVDTFKRNFKVTSKNIEHCHLPSLIKLGKWRKVESK
jgi:hypothetical protein